MTQSLASTVSKATASAISAPAASPTNPRTRAWSGGSAKCMLTSQRPSGRSNAAITASPSKKPSVRRSTTCFAAGSLPIAKFARWVLGVVVEVIGRAA